MIPYFLLIIIPGLMSFFAIDRKRIILSRNSVFVRENNLAIPSFFLLLFLMLAFRDNSIGRDLKNYQVMFNYYLGADWSTIITDYWNLGGQFLFRALSKVICCFTSDFNVYKAIIALLTVLPIGMVYSRERENSFLNIVIFVNMSTFVLLFSGLRQSMAIAIGLFLSYKYTREKKVIAFILSCVLALMLHHSAFMLLLMYPCYHLKLSKKKVVLLLPIIGLIIAFNKQIFLFVSTFLSEYNTKYLGEMTRTGAYGSFALFVAFSIISFIVPNESKLDKEVYGLRNLLLLATVLQSFAALNPLSMRLNYYFIIFIPIIISTVLKEQYSSRREITSFIHSLLTCFFVIFYLYNVYNNSLTGVSALDTYPYVPLWAH